MARSQFYSMSALSTVRHIYAFMYTFMYMLLLHCELYSYLTACLMFYVWHWHCMQA